MYASDPARTSRGSASPTLPLDPPSPAADQTDRPGGRALCADPAAEQAERELREAYEQARLVRYEDGTDEMLVLAAAEKRWHDLHREGRAQE